MVDEFATEGYQRHNHRRQEHLASLGLSLDKKSVLELGAGVGDHTQFWLDRGCEVTCVEGRASNATQLQERHDVEVLVHDLDKFILPIGKKYDIVYAYGVLYHLHHPRNALQQWASVCQSMLLLETCVSTDRSEFGIPEDAACPTASLRGYKCRPTRHWVYRQLSRLFQHVYMPTTQPDHEEFPTDWNNVQTDGLTRAVFVASRLALPDTLPLVQRVPETQERLCE